MIDQYVSKNEKTNNIIRKIEEELCWVWYEEEKLFAKLKGPYHRSFLLRNLRFWVIRNDEWENRPHEPEIEEVEL